MNITISIQVKTAGALTATLNQLHEHMAAMSYEVNPETTVFQYPPTHFNMLNSYGTCKVTIQPDNVTFQPIEQQ